MYFWCFFSKISTCPFFRQVSCKSTCPMTKIYSSRMNARLLRYSLCKMILKTPHGMNRCALSMTFESPRRRKICKIFLWGHWQSCSEDIYPGVQSQGSTLACVLCHLHAMDSSDSPLVRNLLTSWWPACLSRFAGSEYFNRSSWTQWESCFGGGSSNVHSILSHLSWQMRYFLDACTTIMMTMGRLTGLF